MKVLASLIWLVAITPVLAGENTIFRDGTNSVISFCLPTHEMDHGQDVRYGSFTIWAARGNASLLSATLDGTKTEDGENLVGTIVIPSSLVDLAQITVFGSPSNSTRGVSRTFKVSTFKIVDQSKQAETNAPNQAFESIGDSRSPQPQR